MGALLPAFSALHGRGDTVELGRVYRTAMRYVAVAGLPIAAVMAALAPGVIHWLYGAAYLPAARLLSVLVVVAVVGALRKVAFSTDGFTTMDIQLDTFYVDGEPAALSGERYIRVEVFPWAGYAPASIPEGSTVQITGRLMWDGDGWLEIHPESASDISRK